MGAGVYPYKIDPLGSPRHKLGAGLRLDLDWGGYVDVAAQYLASATIARLSATPTPTNPYEETALAPYLMANARGGYVFRSGVDLSLAVSNLFDDRTRHYPGAEAPARRFTATLAWTH
jgi:outer membrane receptor protein involved in Fe transport